jgi:hypothetical protein
LKEKCDYKNTRKKRPNNIEDECITVLIVNSKNIGEKVGEISAKKIPVVNENYRE